MEPTYQSRIYLKTFQLEKKFLSNKNAENYYIRDIIKSIAISHPKINFNYTEDKKQKFVFFNKGETDFYKNRVLEIMEKIF